MERLRRLPVWLASVGVLSILAGAVLVATDATGATAATTTLQLTSTAAGVTCNNSSPTAPVCSGLASGDVVDVSGTGFSPGALASIVQCNSDPAQPVILFLGNDIPVSCSPLSIVTVPSTGASKGDLSGTHTMTTGTVGPPITGQPDTCNQTVPTSSTIANCTATTAAADAANYPCPPTAAQQAEGITCVLAIGDQAGDRAIGTVLFGTETLPTSTTTTAAGATTTTGASSTTTGPTSTTTGPTTTTTGATTTTTGPTTTTTGATTTTTGPTTTTTGPTTTTTTGPTATTTAPSTGVTASYELYCPGTPVGNVVLNGVATVGSLSPSSPSSGGTFNLTGYQTTVNIPASLASAAAALSPTLTGSATTQVDASGATPAKTSVGPLDFSVPIPSPVPSSGVTLTLPSSPMTLGPFTATGSSISIAEDSSASLTLIVGGTPLSLTCTAYPDNSVTPSGITTQTPTASPIDPVIALSGSTTTTTGPSSTTTTTTTGTPTTVTSTLSGGGQTGGTVVVPSGTSVSDQATLTGANASSATGTVTYRVFSLSTSPFGGFQPFANSSWDNWFLMPVANAGKVSVTSGSVPPSNTETFRAGVYFWRARYSGDTLNAPSSPIGGVATEIVLPAPCPTGVGWLSVRCFAGSGGLTGSSTGSSGGGSGGGGGSRSHHGDGWGSGGFDPRHDGGRGSGHGRR